MDQTLKRPRPPAPAAALPSRDDIRRFVRDAPGRVGKREIAAHFGLTATQRTQLRDLLADMARTGDVAPAGRRRFADAAAPAADAVIVQVTGTDADGDPVARPVNWPSGQGAPPTVWMAPEARGQPALAPGQRVLARLRPLGAGRYEGRTVKRLAGSDGRIVGVFHAAAHGGGRIEPTSRRDKADWAVPPGQSADAQDGEIVRAAPLPHTGHGPKPAQVTERLGRLGDARAISLIVVHAADIPTEFTPEALAQAEAAAGVGPDGREDLRHVPLVTIDGDDARDFDDAVFAERTGAGFRLLVAIADVAHYVRPGSALDHAARLRGNSCYFPDRVVPMLPEALSNGWCSLRPHEDRGCLFAEIHVDGSGAALSHRFGRGLMRSAARLTYEQVQGFADAGQAPDGLPIADLYAAFRALIAARTARGTLDLDLPERRVVLGADGRVESVAPRPRLDSHRLIEEFMVLANVQAAAELERLHMPCVYRVHAPPSDEKLEALRAFLRGFDVSLPPGDQIHPRDLDRVLRRVAGTPQAGLVNETILRSQSQAAYAVDNIGHFGLALPRYAHFTSPIRRYADLLVHRALIRGLRLGEDGLADASLAGLADTSEHITGTERRAATAERDAIDRYLAAFMADKVGAVFPARISGVTRFGLFVTLDGSGASGLVPVSTLPDDYWVFEEAHGTLSSRRHGLTFRLAQTVSVRLASANAVTGSLAFTLQPGAAAARPAGARDRRSRA